jgi:hypothetical protein
MQNNMENHTRLLWLAGYTELMNKCLYYLCKTRILRIMTTFFIPVTLIRCNISSAFFRPSSSYLQSQRKRARLVGYVLWFTVGLRTYKLDKYYSIYRHWLCKIAIYNFTYSYHFLYVSQRTSKFVSVYQRTSKVVSDATRSKQ